MKLPRFTLRDLLWLVLVVGLAVGWWSNRREIVTIARDRFEQEMHLLKKYFHLRHAIEDEGYVVDEDEEATTISKAPPVPGPDDPPSDREQTK